MWLDSTVRISLRGSYVCSQLCLTAYSWGGVVRVTVLVAARG